MNRVSTTKGPLGRLVFVAAALLAVSGCAPWVYRPPIPTDYVGWRYSQHNFLKKTFSKSSYRSGNYRVTVTTRTAQYFGRRRLRTIPDQLPPISRANQWILNLIPGLLNRPFRSVDGSTAPTAAPSPEGSPPGTAPGTPTRVPPRGTGPTILR